MYKGEFGNFHFQSAPDYIWTLAEKYLGLQAGALAHIHAIAVCSESTASAKFADLSMKIIDAQEVRGLKVQPLNKWGVESFRISQIIGDDLLDNDYLSSTLGFNSDERRYPVAPEVANSTHKVTKPIYDADGNITGYMEVADGLSPNGGNWQSGLPNVATPVADKVSQEFETSIDVVLSCDTEGADIYYTTDGSEPSSTNGTKYTEAVSISATTTLKAKAIKTAYVPSQVVTYTYTLQA